MPFGDAWQHLTEQFRTGYTGWQSGVLHQTRFDPELLDYVDVAPSLAGYLAPSASGSLATVNVSNFDSLDRSLEVTILPSTHILS
jgi:hypothetical protein